MTPLFTFTVTAWHCWRWF